MGVKIALAGNPNSGKTTLFNALTGSNQFVGNSFELLLRKEGKWKERQRSCNYGPSGVSILYHHIHWRKL